MRSLILLSAYLVAVATTTTPAFAQEITPQSEDWTLTSAPERKAVLATIDFTSGLTIAARCVDNAYDVLITGLPEATRGSTSRELGIQAGDQEQPYTSVWTVGTQRSMAFSRLPAVVARDLAKGGKLQVIVPGNNGGPRTRYVMELDPSSTAIEQTLTACGRPRWLIRAKPEQPKLTAMVKTDCRIQFSGKQCHDPPSQIPSGTDLRSRATLCSLASSPPRAS